MTIFRHRLLLASLLALVAQSVVAEEYRCSYTDIINNNKDSKTVYVWVRVTDKTISYLNIYSSVQARAGWDVNVCPHYTTEETRTVAKFRKPTPDGKGWIEGTYDPREQDVSKNSKWTISGATSTLEYQPKDDRKTSEKRYIKIERVGNSFRINLERAPLKCDENLRWPKEVTLEIGNDICAVKYGALSLGVIASNSLALKPSGYDTERDVLLTVYADDVAKVLHDRGPGGGGVTQFSIATVDLDRDGVPEIVGRFDHPYFCGSNGCRLVILSKQTTGDWVEVARLATHGSIYFHDEYINNYRAITSDEDNTKWFFENGYYRMQSSPRSSD